jgi:hypothetical protein
MGHHPDYFGECGTQQARIDYLEKMIATDITFLDGCIKKEIDKENGGVQRNYAVIESLTAIRKRLARRIR